MEHVLPTKNETNRKGPGHIYTYIHSSVQAGAEMNKNKYTQNKPQRKLRGLQNVSECPLWKSRRSSGLYFNQFGEKKQAVGSENERVMSGLVGIPMATTWSENIWSFGFGRLEGGQADYTGKIFENYSLGTRTGIEQSTVDQPVDYRPERDDYRQSTFEVFFKSRPSTIDFWLGGRLLSLLWYDIL